MLSVIPTPPRRERSERRSIQADLRRLAREERQRQEAAVKEVVAGAQVIASTLTGLLHPNLEVRIHPGGASRREVVLYAISGN
jgi:hypothetical protein